MWQGIKDSVAAFFKNPIKAIFDPNYTIEYQVQTMADEGRTLAEIDQTLTGNGFVKGSTVNDIYNTMKDIVTFTAKNLPAIVFAVILIVVAWYVLQIKKVVNA